MYIPRYAEALVQRIAETFKVLYVGGARQVGKTTLLLHLAEGHKRRYVSLDDLAQRKLAQSDPELFLQRHPAPLLIDEVQYAPDLFSYLKLRVDANEAKGQYWLTGSQQFSLMAGMQESLAGRVGIVHLLGLSHAEIQRRPYSPQPFMPNQLPSSPVSPQDINDIFSIIVRGSYPALWQEPAAPLEQFFSSYLETYIDRDIAALFGVEKIAEFHTFLQLLAARTGQLLNYSDLARDAGVSVHAAREWLNILTSTSQIYLLRPYHRNITKRLVKSPKLYLLDTGLGAYLARWQTAEALLAGAQAGAFLETFVVSELVKSYRFRGEEPPLYFLRDRQGHEVDVVIIHEQSLFPLEVKLRSQVSESDVGDFRYFKQHLPDLAAGAVICLAPKRRPLTRDVDVVPVGEIA